MADQSKVGPDRKRPKTGGRQKGTPNKTTTQLKEIILEALDRSGGVEYLITQARDNPNAFMTLVGKVLPLQVNGPGEDGALVHEVRWKVIGGS